MNQHSGFVPELHIFGIIQPSACLPLFHISGILRRVSRSVFGFLLVGIVRVQLSSSTKSLPYHRGAIMRAWKIVLTVGRAQAAEKTLNFLS